VTSTGASPRIGVRRRMAGRPTFLCAAIAVALGGWPCASLAAATADASPAAAAGGANASAPSDVDFDRSLLSGSGQNTTDLSRFERGNPVLPGEYSVDVFLDGAWVARRSVRFAATSPNASAIPCVDRKMLEALGLHPAKLDKNALAHLDDAAGCVALTDLIPGATMNFDMTQLRLDATVPQSFMGQAARGYVSPQYWDPGVTSGILNYNFNGYRNTDGGNTQTSTYLGLNTGVNLGLWHLREDATVTWQSASHGTPSHYQWQNIDAYIQRDLPSLRATLTLGDSFTDGAVFDSFGIRGVQLATNDRMLPQSLQGYAPIVHGVAQTNAKVTVRQNGVQIYQTTVPPGPFTINDLYPTGYGGNLDVTVTEADGRVSTFSVPYASVAQLLRPGIWRFDIAAGELRQTSISTKPAVLQATAQHGFSNLLTGYAGLVGAQGYGAALFGTAIDTRFGALALDVTQAVAHIPGYATQSGQSMRITYSKVMTETNTTLAVSAYRYSTGGYLSLTQAEEARSYVREGQYAFTQTPINTLPVVDGVTEHTILTPSELASLNGSAFNPVISATGIERQRSNFTLTLNQPLGKIGGNLYANVAASDYWNKRGTNTQFQLGYNNHYRTFSYSVSAVRSVDPQGRYDNEVLLSFNVPLGSSAHAPTLMLNLTHDQQGESQAQAMVNGTLGVDSQFSYGASATHATDGGGNSGNVNMGYRSPFAVFNASAGEGSGYSQASVSVSGSVIAHPGGVSFGQPLGDTVGIVYAPGAAGARVINAAGARIDSNGYAVVPYMTPYSLNNIQIDPKGLPLDVQLDATSAQVAPYAGAVVMMTFKTENGRTIILQARLSDGTPLPFGAQVYNDKSQVLGVVGQSGQILARGVNDAGTLTARWQDDQGDSHACSMTYHAPARDKHDHTSAKSLDMLNITCVPVHAATATQEAAP
jgi:outer membrane usher protein